MSKNVGTAVWIVHPAIGNNTLFQNHSSPAPMFDVSGSSACNRPWIDVRRGVKFSFPDHSTVAPDMFRIVPRIILNRLNMLWIIFVPVLFFSQASCRPEAILPIILNIFWKITSKFVSINSPVPFVHTFRKLRPILLTRSQTLLRAYFMLEIVAFPSLSHACLNGSKILLIISLNFLTQGNVAASNAAILGG